MVTGLEKVTVFAKAGPPNWARTSKATSRAPGRVPARAALSRPKIPGLASGDLRFIGSI